MASDIEELRSKVDALCHGFFIERQNLRIALMDCYTALGCDDSKLRDDTVSTINKVMKDSLGRRHSPGHRRKRKVIRAGRKRATEANKPSGAN